MKCCVHIAYHDKCKHKERKRNEKNKRANHCEHSFRQNIKQAFDEAERGEPVYIDRNGTTFVLMESENYSDTLLAAAVKARQETKNNEEKNDGRSAQTSIRQ